MRALIAAVVATSVCFTASAFAGISKADLNDQIDRTNFLVNDNCSGTLVAPGMILTANHCIADKFRDVETEEVQKDGTVKKVKRRVANPGTVSQLLFAGSGETQRTVYVYKIKDHDADHDLGLVQTVSQIVSKPTPVACRQPKRLDAVYAVGNPFALLYSTATTGIVASVNRDYRLLGIDGGGDPAGDGGLIQHTAPIEGGNSGGALYNEDGQLIGVNVRGSPVNETVAFAVPLDDVRKFLADNKVELPACK